MTGLTTKELGQTIRAARKKRGISQEELAKHLGVTKSTISKYELGHREPSLEQLIEIADALSLGGFALVPEVMQNAYFSGFNSLALTDRYKNATNESDADDALFDFFDLIDLFNKLDISGQKWAIECVRALAEQTSTLNNTLSHPLEDVLIALFKLNADGQKIAAERIKELAEIPKYQKAPDATNIQD